MGVLKELVFSVALFIAITLWARPEMLSRPQAKELRFDVVSIKPVKWEQGNYHGGACHGIDSQYRPDVTTSPPPLGRCVFPNTLLSNIIQFAYKQTGKLPFRISGGEKWVMSDAFEVQATSDDPDHVTEAQLCQMLDVVLRERFKLQFHRETHAEQGFALAIANKGANLKPVNGNEARPGPIFVHRDGAELIVTGEQITIGTLINFLAANLQQPILDETGLAGIYNVVLHFTPSAGETSSSSVGSTSEPAGPSLFTALQDQLGLRLEPQKVTVDIFVIDHVEHPIIN